MAESTQLNDLRRITPETAALAVEFFAAVPDRDRMFFKEPVDADTVRRWSEDERIPRWLLVGDDGRAQAYLAVVPGVGWNAHVGDLRLVVAEHCRRRGLGRRLARAGLLAGLRSGLEKLTVEVVADKQGDIDMFTSIGFEGEALLKNQIRDREGRLRDLVILGHDVQAVRDGMELVGLDEALGMGPQA